MENKFDLFGKTAVVTGGGGVLGSVFAKTLASAWAKVAVLGRTRSALDKTVAEIRAAGGTAMAAVGDVTDPESLRQAEKLICDAFGPCEILINAAGGNHPDATVGAEYFDPADGKNFFSLSPEGIGRVFGLNFTGTLLATQIFAEKMTRTGGAVINISSMNAFRPLTKIPAYSAAKAAVTNLTEWMAVYFAGCGIRVNALAPGFFSTEQNKALLWNADGSPTARTGKILAATPMGRFGVPEELGGALLFLADDKLSGFVTGVTLPVDGGFNAYSGV